MIETSDDIQALAAALVTFQGEAHGVKKDSSNPHFKTRYASLEAVIEAARPGLQKAGIAFLQAPGAIADGKLSMDTMLIHAASGQWLRSTMQIVLGKSDPQGVGSAITYAARYALMATLGLPPVDDDGEAAMPRQAPPTRARVRMVSNQQLGSPTQMLGNTSGDIANNLIGGILAAKDEAGVQRVTMDPDNVQAFEELDQPDQDRVLAAVEVARKRFGRGTA